MIDFIHIRGYAAPFDRTRYVAADNLVESIAAEAFDAMLLADDPPCVPVLWDSHEAEAPLLCRKAQLHVDGYGLGFSAVVDVRNENSSLSSRWGYLQAMVRGREPKDQVSVFFDKMESTVAEGTRRITKATIKHVTICGNAVYGRYTGCWPKHLIDDDEAPWRLREMNATWMAGREEMSPLFAQRRDLLKQAKAIANGPGRGPGDDLSERQMDRFEAIARKVSRIDSVISGRRRVYDKQRSATCK